MKLLVIGSLNADLVINTDILPKMGETVFGNKFSVVCGGKGANQAIVAAKLGCDVKMIGSVGNDVFGEKLISNLKENNVGAEGVQICECSSGIAVITVFNGDNSIILEKGANEKTDINLIDEKIDLIKWADAILFQFEVPMETVLYAAKKGEKMGKTIVINPAPAQKIPEELFKYCDIIVPNETETKTITGIDLNSENPKKAIKYFKEKGCSQVIITLGEKGSVYTDGDEIKNFGIYKTEVVDTTAAGDSFIASYLTAKSEGKSTDEAIKFASQVSSIVVSREGAATSIPTKEEVEKL